MSDNSVNNQTVPTSQTSGFAHLGSFDRTLAEVVSKPRWTIYAVTALAVLLAWFWLSVIVANLAGGSASLGPGMGSFQLWLRDIIPFSLDNPVIAWLIKICAPQQVESVGLTAFATTFAMWMMMSVAMMLPSAAPMLRTYADIADVAAQKGEKVVSLAVLAAGYLAVWLVFCLLATTAQLSLVFVGLIADPVFPVEGVLAGLLLIAAGAYQFSNLKYACLEKCRNPFSFLFGRWTDRPMGVFKLGLEQGFFCVGCCWALMLVMLVVGTMNLAWMAFFTLFTIIEKSGRGKVTSHWSGGILMVWGGALVALAIWTAFVN